MERNKEQSEFKILIVKAQEGLLSDDERLLLNELMALPENQQLYFEMVKVNCALLQLESVDFQHLKAIDTNSGFNMSLLEELAEYQKTAPPAEIPKEEVERELVQKVSYQEKIININRRSLAKVALSLAAMLLFAVILNNIPERTDFVEVATVINLVDVEGDDLHAFRNGNGRLLSNDILQFNKGLVEIQTDNGVELVIEGPAEFEFTKSGDLILDNGKVYATVSVQGKGFSVATATSKIIDLGTEFGVQADRSGSTEVHVYKGKVTLLAGNTAMEKVTEFLLQGQASVISSDGTVSKRPVNDHLFVCKDEMDARVRGAGGSAYHRWLAYSYKLRRNPALTAYYTFHRDGQQPDKLINAAAMTAGKLDGVLESNIPNGNKPLWIEGRWPQKDALRFDREKLNSVKIAADPSLCISGPISIAAWVMCPQKGDGGHVLSCRTRDVANYQVGYLLKGGHELQFLRYGQFLDQDKIIYNHKKVNLFEQQADWKLVVITHDNKQVRFFIDGKLIDEREFNFQGMPVQADLGIGRALGYSSNDPALGFSGVIDEVAVFKSVLSDLEIKEMYEAGKP